MGTAVASAAGDGEAGEKARVWKAETTMVVSCQGPNRAMLQARHATFVNSVLALAQDFGMTCTVGDIMGGSKALMPGRRDVEGDVKGD